MAGARCVLLCSAAELRNAKHAQSGEVGNSEKRRRKLVLKKGASQDSTLPTLESLKRVVVVAACRRLERRRMEAEREHFEALEGHASNTANEPYT